ncbi:MAG TPA: DUF1697 domain-containing protein [Fimbriimonas sp.]|nr:DUF1697 domain-containing protein [Fimbriimonas sp.]
MKNYLALLRGINVGGNNLIPMGELRRVASEAGFHEVSSYIQSGNLIFKAEGDEEDLARQLERVIEAAFGRSVGVVVFEGSRWKKIIASAPEKWGSDTSLKHNIIAILDRDPLELAAQDPDLENYVMGDQVVFQSLDHGYQPKPAPKAIQQRVTVRNSNTAKRLADLL